MEFPVTFSKMSGTGNDFIVIDHRRPLLDRSEFAAFARAVCRRKFSVGADGLILIENCDTADFQWRFYNADGSEAEMCGNGARCAARFARENKITPAKMRFLTIAGEIEAEVKGELVKLAMTRPTDISLSPLQLVLGGGPREIYAINTGVPHAVCFVEDNHQTPVKEWGRVVRFHDSYQPAGTNANFVRITGPDALHVRTYERGVEDETMACGTGAVASAVMAGLLGRVTSPVKVTTSGGEILTVYFTIKNQGPVELEKIYLEGPAHFIYEGKLCSEAITNYESEGSV